MYELTDIEKQILKIDNPNISFFEDIEIERYFELRKIGNLESALEIYNKALRSRYPNEKTRINLISWYRQKDVRFQNLLTKTLIERAQATILHVKKVITYITSITTTLKISNIHAVIETCEKLVTAISSDRYEAVSFTQKYYRYATILNYNEKEMNDAANLIRLYVTDSLSSIRDFKEKEKKEKARTAAQKAREKYRPKTFDFSKIIFTKEQVEAITISTNIKHIEDIVIAYAMKYWNRYNDALFQQTILLYSRKYKTKHYSIFQALKIGRVRGWRDEEILQAILANVVSGYYYSISGDVYLQKTWQRAKSALTPSAQKLLPEPKKEEAPKIKKTTKKKRTTKKTKDAEEPKPITRTTRKKKEITIKPAVKKATVTKPKKEKVSPQTKKSALKKEEKKTPLIQKPKRIKKEPIKKPLPPLSETKKTLIKTEEPKSSISTHHGSFISLQQNSSIDSLIKKMLGKKYGVYKELFFNSVRPAIRTVLEKSMKQKLLFFKPNKNKAEDIIYHFFKTEYDNPFQQWSNSDSQKKLSSLGYEIPSLEPILAEWIKQKNLTT